MEEFVGGREDGEIERNEKYDYVWKRGQEKTGGY